ncbi:Sperm flagellar protein 2 [Microtus ochrogaster]|uniref:Sperm flagellar protein 2 n=1 Tax=Microtus ochrogaster TaxID=79684 RepID=A0A8J6GU79_MICOH|nr:Sperm flagellar protein 2 [Microtus ochrogaster]
MSEILCQWLNRELKVSRTVSPKSFAKAFSNGYLIGEVLYNFELQSDFAEFSESRGSTAKLNNFSRLEPTLHLLGVQFDQNVAQSIITEKPGAATKLLYQLYIALQKKKKTGLTGLEIQTMQPQTNLRLQTLKSEAFREDVANEIKKFEALIKKDLQAKESASKASLETTDQTATDLLNTYSDDDYIKKIQKRLEEDAFAREQREKRRRRLLMDQLIAHEAQEALAKQAKIDFAEQTLREKETHEKIAVERAQARFEKHYGICAEILDQILDLCTKVADYRLLTDNLIPHKMMHDWKELFFSGKPIYEQASLKNGITEPTEEHLIELDKRNLLDKNDYEEYKNMVGEWALPEDMANSSPPSNNHILGYVLQRLIEKSNPSQDDATETELPSYAVKGCFLGKTLSGKTTVLKYLQKEFSIRVLSIDSLVNEAIRAFNDNEQASGLRPVRRENKGEPRLDPREISKIQAKPVEDYIPQVILCLYINSVLTKFGLPVKVIISTQFNIINACEIVGSQTLTEIRETEMEGKHGHIKTRCLLSSCRIQMRYQFLQFQGKRHPKKKAEKKKAQMPTLALGPTLSKEVTPIPSAFDFAILLDISDNLSLDRMNDIIAKELSHEISHENIAQQEVSTCQERDGDNNLRDQIHHRSVLSFVRYLEPLMQVRFYHSSEVEKILEEKEAEKKAAASGAEAPTTRPPLPSEAEKDKEMHLHREPSKLSPGKGKTPSGKTPGGKIPVKKSPAGSVETSPTPTAPPPPKPGSEEWVYVTEPIPEVAAEVHQRLIEEEKELPPMDSKEKSPQSGANKKAKKEKEAPKKKKAEKKGKGKSSPVAEVSPITVSPEELAEMERRNELKLKIKEEHLAALQMEEFGEKEISILISHYEPVLEAANVKTDEVDTEWSMLKLEIYARFQNVRKLTWDFVNSIYSHKYPNILMLVDLVLALPASSAEPERGCSQIKRSHSHMDEKTKAESLTDILVIQLNSPDISSFDPRKAIHLWTTRTQSSAAHVGPDLDSSSISESQDERDE